ncbi:hypothetical protein CHUAL_010412 [Chamberlinius hualienensis]
MLTLNVRHAVMAAPLRRYISISQCVCRNAGKSNDYEVVVVGGGTGGCSMAAKFSRKLGPGKVAVIEPNDTHYYQPMWTLVGGGIKTFATSGRPMKDILPNKATWIKDRVVSFDPANNKLATASGDQIGYKYMIVAAGIQLNYHLVKGVNEALKTPGVCSNYSPEHVTKTFPAIQQLSGGNAIFTFPNTPIKCAGAPQKIMYLAEDYLRKNGKRDKVEVIYVTSLAAMFGVKKYAEALAKIVQNRNIKVYFRHHLVEVNPAKNEAIFENLDKPDTTLILPYSLLHVTPPMSPPDFLKTSPLADNAGWVDVNKHTLQHNKFPNVFALGDCTSVPTSRTAAAVAAQTGVLYRNMSSVMTGSVGQSKYDGYTSCPLVTGYGKCILAEFDFDGQPLETLPIDQGVERRLSYEMKKEIMPRLYWNLMMKGFWEGPKIIRKLTHLGLSR